MLESLLSVNDSFGKKEYIEREIKQCLEKWQNKSAEKKKLEDLGFSIKVDGKHIKLEQSGFSPVIDVEDHNMIMMQLENGAQAVYMQCHYSPDAERNYTFIGTRGRVENIGDSGNCQIHVWNRRGPRSTPDIIYNLKKIAGSHDGADGPIINNFLDFIKNGTKTNVNPVAARNSVAVGVLGHLSMRSGNMPQDIPPLAPELLEYFAGNQESAR